ncbi:YwbE family protein [Gorillibacterium sp. sgz500922]|uniref:YwbE family protein n=1 Tax=Gorillibacterium sp. sgz500922 TaxID=3446694 RepID=UPI003F66C531
MDGRKRSDVRPGLEVDIVLKADQRTGRLTRGFVKELLTNSPTHPHGIKVRLTDGQVGRVQAIVGGGAAENGQGKDGRE